MDIFVFDFFANSLYKTSIFVREIKIPRSPIIPVDQFIQVFFCLYELVKYMAGDMLDVAVGVVTGALRQKAFNS